MVDWLSVMLWPFAGVWLLWALPWVVFQVSQVSGLWCTCGFKYIKSWGFGGVQTTLSLFWPEGCWKKIHLLLLWRLLGIFSGPCLVLSLSLFFFWVWCRSYSNGSTVESVASVLGPKGGCPWALWRCKGQPGAFWIDRPRRKVFQEPSRNEVAII